MSNLFQVQKKPLFGWYYVWLKLSDIGEPQQDINAGMQQLDTIKVSWDQLDSNQSGGIQALSVSVVPNKGIFRAEYSLIYTIEEFTKKIKRLQGAAATKWIAVLDQFPVATHIDIMFKEAQKAYLKKIAE
eukprot:8789001-Ditylum_brightwellii.AAC.1